ncbi:MAG: 16S rRNA (cytidine(1402)-2'-O)-methyltransferase [Holosporales bacterium]|jgi:16S rRNA (cytidine1402-2'-O)-methyltransferase|nr:16S rRNA (cytidine(1402)-2'-O)-methyltransferase [Holosporales bacterium]
MKTNVYFISTPIGNLGDFSMRGIETLKSVNCILCEDTRVSSKLLQNFEIKSKLLIYNDHNASFVIPKIIHSIKSESMVYALISDAGTPLISDPGYKLVNACIKNNIKYTVIPGACAVISALILSGLPSNRFLFSGFANYKEFEKLSKIDSTIIFFEAPSRIIKTLKNMKQYFDDRIVAIVREITKIHEESIRANIDSLILHFEEKLPKGEFVIVISPPENDSFSKIKDTLPIIDALVDKLSKKDLADALAKYLKIGKNSVYDFISNYKKYKK